MTLRALILPGQKGSRSRRKHQKLLPINSVSTACPSTFNRGNGGRGKKVTSEYERTYGEKSLTRKIKFRFREMLSCLVNDIQLRVQDARKRYKIVNVSPNKGKRFPKYRVTYSNTSVIFFNFCHN